MRNAGRAVRTAHPLWMALIVGLTGCGTVLGIDDWQDTGAGGAGGGSASATTGQGGAQTSSVATGSTASGMTGTEICNNQVDDDADGLVDCADSDCAAYTCTALVPAGWIGPVAIAMGSAGSAPPPCGPEWATELDFLTGTLTAPDAQCSPCTCGPPSGGQCSLSPQTNLTFYADSACTMVGSPTALSPNQCTVATSPPNVPVQSFKISGGASPSVGACAESGGSPSVQPASFDKVARICEGPVRGEGCGTDKGCVPPPPPSFRPSLCIYRQVNDELDPTCPAGYTPLPFFYKDIVDTRGCVSCQCGGATGQSCSISAGVYGDSTCTSGVPYTLNQCNPLAGPMTSVSIRVKVDPGQPAGGSCSPLAQSTPIGEANGTARTLACCLP